MMQFNIYGTLSLVILILIALINEFIINANVSSKYKKLQTTINANSVKNASSHVEKKLLFLPNQYRFWTPMFNQKKQVIYVNKSAFSSSSIFDQVNTMFSVQYFFIKKNNFFENVLYRVILFFVSINIAWSLVFLFLPVFIPSIIFYLLIFVLDFSINFPNYRKALKKSITILIENTNEQEQLLIKKYAQFLLYNCFTKYLMPLTSGVIGLAYIFKNWGTKNEWA